MNLTQVHLKILRNKLDWRFQLKIATYVREKKKKKKLEVTEIYKELNLSFHQESSRV
jgi:hypothetical protein